MLYGNWAHLYQNALVEPPPEQEDDDHDEHEHLDQGQREARHGIGHQGPRAQPLGQLRAASGTMPTTISRTICQVDVARSSRGIGGPSLASERRKSARAGAGPVC
jgi:hypothetical protein